MTPGADPWYQGKLAQSIGKGGSKAMMNFNQDSQSQQGQNPAPTYGSAAPPLNPYRSGHVDRQAAYADDIMKSYLSGGGYG
jgi:hypothetical protein